MKKRLLSMILALGMMLTILPVNAITALAENGKTIQSGNCGNNVTYDLTQNNDDDANKTYTLTIRGNGKMNDYSDYSYNYSPWHNKESAITQVVFEGDITTIGNYSFYRCTRLTSITIPNSVISIGTGAFLDCTGLKEITMPDDSNFKLHSIGAYAFEDCRSLKSITIPSSVQSIGKHAFYESFGSLKVYWPTVLSDHITVDDDLGSVGITYYYPGYKSAWDVQKSKISNFRGLNSVRYYCDVTIDANGGSFSDGTETKVVKKVWSGEKLTQEQVKAIGVPKNAQKAFFGWKYNPIYITENLENVVIEDSMTFCADYSGNTVTLGQLNNGNELVKGNSYEFTVTINTYCADSGSPIKKLTFGDVAGTIKYKNSKIEGAGGLEVTLPDGGEKNTLTFTFTPNEVGQNKTLTAYLDGLKYKEEEYGPVTSSTTYSVRDRQNAEVTIDGLDGTTVKAGKAQDFTVNVTPNDDANTGAKATITVSGANADAVEKIQYKDGATWKDVPGEGLSIDKINNTEFKLITKADANDGDVTITVIAKKADGTEVARKDASFTVTKKEEPVTPGGGSTGGGEKPGENPGGDSGNTNPTPKPDEKPDRKIKIDGGIVEVNGKEVKPDEDGNITVKKGDEITITVDKSKISDAQVFDQWVIKPDSVLNEVDPKSEKISFTMPAEDVTIEAMTRDASIEDDGPGILGTGALIATGVVGSAALLYQGHMLGTELYLRYLLPHGAVIPQNRAELAVLLWQDAENPEPVSTTLYSDISDEDSAIQQAARWAVENDLMEQLDAEEHPDHFDPFVPVTFSDSIRAWKKAQELKKSVH